MDEENGYRCECVMPWAGTDCKGKLCKYEIFIQVKDDRTSRHKKVSRNRISCPAIGPNKSKKLTRLVD